MAQAPSEAVRRGPGRLHDLRRGASSPGMHPQTLRIYEERGLIKPARSPKQTRLYSQRDVERLRRIQELTTEFGMNLAGVERVLALEEMMEAMQAALERLPSARSRWSARCCARIDEVHRSYRRELVPWQPPGAALGLGERPHSNAGGAAGAVERGQHRVQHRARPRWAAVTARAATSAAPGLEMESTGTGSTRPRPRDERPAGHPPPRPGTAARRLVALRRSCLDQGGLAELARARWLAASSDAR